jgi:hypothetical protein
MACQEKQTHRKAACWFTESSCTMHFLMDASQMVPRQLATRNTFYRIKLTFPERRHLMYILLSFFCGHAKEIDKYFMDTAKQKEKHQSEFSF